MFDLSLNLVEQGIAQSVKLLIESGMQREEIARRLKLSEEQMGELLKEEEGSE